MVKVAPRETPPAIPFVLVCLPLLAGCVDVHSNCIARSVTIQPDASKLSVKVPTNPVTWKSSRHTARRVRDFCDAEHANELQAGPRKKSQSSAQSIQQHAAATAYSTFRENYPDPATCDRNNRLRQ